MAKYDFFAIKEAARKNRTLPADVNEPIKKWLIEKLNLPLAVQMVERFESHFRCGKIPCVTMDRPTESFELKVQFGIVEKMYCFETIKDSKSVVTGQYTVFNPNIFYPKGRKEE